MSRPNRVSHGVWADIKETRNHGWEIVVWTSVKPDNFTDELWNQLCGNSGALRLDAWEAEYLWLARLRARRLIKKWDRPLRKETI